MTFDGTLTICGKPFFEQQTTTNTATGVHLPIIRTYQIIAINDYPTKNSK